MLSINNMFKLKRIYEKYEKSDGYRILVDRLWPRGMSKEKARVDLWLKDIAPSAELRQWFNHDPKKWPEFQRRYEKELKLKKEIVAELKNIIKKEKTATILFAAFDAEHNDAVALAKILKLKM